MDNNQYLSNLPTSGLVAKLGAVAIQDQTYVSTLGYEQSILDDYASIQSGLGNPRSISRVVLAPQEGQRFGSQDAETLQLALERIVPNRAEDGKPSYEVTDLDVFTRKGSLTISTRMPDTNARTSEFALGRETTNRETETMVRLMAALYQLGVPRDQLAPVMREPEMLATATRLGLMPEQPRQFDGGLHRLSPEQEVAVNKHRLLMLTNKMETGSGSVIVAKGEPGSNRVTGYVVRVNVTEAGLEPKEAQQLSKLLTRLTGTEFKCGKSSAGYDYVESARVESAAEAKALRGELGNLGLADKQPKQPERGADGPARPPRQR